MSDGSVARAGAREAVRVAGQVRTQSANLDICDKNKQIEREMHALAYSWRKNQLLLAPTSTMYKH